DLLGRRQHILQRAYDNLPPAAQITLGRLAAFRAAVPWDTIAAVFGDNRHTRANLHLLEQRGLLQRSIPPAPLLPSSSAPPPTFDLHPIARRYAYKRLADRAAVHGRLIIYFEAVPQPPKVTSLADLAPAIELYHHLTRAERYDEAFDLFYNRINKATYYQLGAYQKTIELLRALFPDGEDKPPRLSKESAQGWTLNSLANSYGMAGQPGAAVPVFQQAVDMAEKLGDKQNTAISLGNLANGQTEIGALAAAADNLRRSIALCQKIEDRFWEAVGHAEYGRLLIYCNDWAKSAAELDAALELFEADEAVQYQGNVWAYRALSALLQGDGVVAQHAAQEALHLADETARTHYPYERDYVQAHWLLGWAALVAGNHLESQTRLDEALRRCRAINLVELEPATLLAQARLARAVKRNAISFNYAQQAVTIAQRAGHVLDLADCHNHLALLALDAGDTAAARSEALAHAQTARDYAFCDGPPYAYQSALDEAERILNNLSQT
ncbi:MAG: tetratricopeptide repeat protein, partial [Lewinella sp.]|nr:tetratricopeptide repeat protein [Lewinella sp.]